MLACHCPLFRFWCCMEIYKKLARSDNKVTRRLSESGVSFPTHTNVDFDHIEEVLSQMRA